MQLVSPGARPADSRSARLDGTGYACYGRSRFHPPEDRLPTFSHMPRSFALWLLLGTGLVAGCAGAPVQEMSNARQAVRAAEKAGAATAAPELLTEAKKLLKDASAHINEKDYRSARDDAESARTQAIEARRIAEAASAAEVKPTTP